MDTDSIKISLDSIQATTGLLVALAVSIAGLWVVVARPQWINVHHFRQARGLATLAIAVGLALVFVSWANVDGLPRLSQAAIVGVPLCIATFLINVVVQILGSQRRPGVGLVVGYLVTLILYVVSGSIALSASAVMLMVDAEVRSRRVEAESNVQVTVHVQGFRSVTSPGSPSPFRVSSGQVNFGCEQTVEATAQFQLPEGASIASGPVAEWQDIANARDNTAAIEQAGLTITARGVIVGIPTVGFSLPFGGRVANCPGGGHGELVLSGTYVGTQTAEAPFETTLSGSMNGTTLSLPLPLAPDVRLTQATLQFSESGRPMPGANALVLALDSDGSVKEDTANQLFAVHRESDRLEISRRQ